MEILSSPYLLIAVVAIVLAVWSQRFHRWSITGTARHQAGPLQLGLTASGASALFLIAGIAGRSLSKHERFISRTPWTDGVIWWEVAVGIILACVAIYLFRQSHVRAS